MKLSMLIIIVVFFLQANVSSVEAQENNKDVEKLEDLLKLAEKDTVKSVKVKVKGKEESTAKIIVRMKHDSTIPTNIGFPTTVKKSKKVTRSIVDLSNISISNEYIDKKINNVLLNPKCGTLESVKISHIGVSKKYMVLEDYVYNTGTHKITVPKGFVYDRASIPRMFWWLIDKDSLGNVAPLVHDLLYCNKGVLPKNQVSPYKRFSRKEADLLFRRIMGECGVSEWKRNAAFWAVRKFAGFAWKKRTPSCNVSL